MISDFFVRINDDLLQFYIIDVTPPVLRCPQNVTTTTAKGLHYAVVKMTMPVSQGWKYNNFYRAVCGCLSLEIQINSLTLIILHIYIVDNSGFVPTIVSVPALTDEMKFKIGTTEIKIGATDLTGNTKKCSFFVTIIGEENWEIANKYYYANIDSWKNKTLILILHHYIISRWWTTNCWLL